MPLGRAECHDAWHDDGGCAHRTGTRVSDVQPPQPGWWLASDGRWYPPQQATPPVDTPPPPQQPSKSGRGCLFALAIVGIIFLLIAGAATFALWKFADTVKDVADGVTVGDVQCPTEEKVSDLVGHPVDLVASGTVVVASGCNYSSNGNSVGVTIVSGAGLISDDVFAELASSAQAEGTELSSIDVGDNGKAFGGSMRSAAATKDGGHIVEVDIFTEGTDPIGDKKDAAVEILRLYLDLND
jgi:hypothetical protein